MLFQHYLFSCTACNQNFLSIFICLYVYPIFINCFLCYNSDSNCYAEIASAITGPLSEIPNLQQLQNILQQQPVVPIPIDHDVYQIIKPRILNIEKSFISSKTSGYNAGKLSRTITSAFEVDFSGGTEMFQTGIIDHCVDDVLTAVKAYSLVGLIRDRNCSDFTTSVKGNLRPDYLVWYKSVLIIRGEDKKIYKDILDARNELTNKMNMWSPFLYGQLPYLFGYAFAAGQIQFFALHPQEGYGTSRQKLQSTAISDSLPLNDAVGVYKV